MKIFHTHQWKEIARTYSPSFTEMGMLKISSEGFYELRGITTILWECQDKNCQELRKEEMLGKELKK